MSEIHRSGERSNKSRERADEFCSMRGQTGASCRRSFSITWSSAQNESVLDDRIEEVSSRIADTSRNCIFFFNMTNNWIVESKNFRDSSIVWVKKTTLKHFANVAVNW